MSDTAQTDLNRRLGINGQFVAFLAVGLLSSLAVVSVLYSLDVSIGMAFAVGIGYSIPLGWLRGQLRQQERDTDE